MARGAAVTQGMNIIECEKGVKELAALRSELETSLKALKKDTLATDGYWVGPDADRFRSAEWSEIEAAFVAATESIESLRTDLQRNIAQQKATSA